MVGFKLGALKVPTFYSSFHFLFFFFVNLGPSRKSHLEQNYPNYYGFQTVCKCPFRALRYLGDGFYPKLGELSLRRIPNFY